MPIIQINGINQYYEIYGDGQPLVFVHGLGSSTLDWEFQVPVFSKSYKVITSDLRGHGRTDKIEGAYSMQMFAADLAGLLHAMGVEPAHIVGMSLGGAVAFQFAIDYPEYLKTLTIVNSGPTLNEDPEAARQMIEHRADIVQRLGMGGMIDAFVDSLFPCPEHVILRENFIERWNRNDPQEYIKAVRSWQGWNVTDMLDSIKCPTLVISSDEDIWPIEYKQSYVELMPNSELVVIPDAHHAVTVELPDKFNAALMEFLAAIDERDQQSIQSPSKHTNHRI